MPTCAQEIVFPRRAHDSADVDFSEYGNCGQMRGVLFFVGADPCVRPKALEGNDTVGAAREPPARLSNRKNRRLTATYKAHTKPLLAHPNAIGEN